MEELINELANTDFSNGLYRLVVLRLATNPDFHRIYLLGRAARAAMIQPGNEAFLMAFRERALPFIAGNAVMDGIWVDELAVHDVFDQVIELLYVDGWRPYLMRRVDMDFPPAHPDSELIFYADIRFCKSSHECHVSYIGQHSACA